MSAENKTIAMWGVILLLMAGLTGAALIRLRGQSSYGATHHPRFATPTKLPPPTSTAFSIDLAGHQAVEMPPLDRPAKSVPFQEDLRLAPAVQGTAISVTPTFERHAVGLEVTVGF